MIAIRCIAVAAALAGLAAAQEPAGPLSPKEALKTFKVASGFKVELVASEPDVMDPVAMAFDEELAGQLALDERAQSGADVTVLEKGDSFDTLKDADIIVLGAGEPGLVKPEHIKDGVVLIDAGTSEVSGKVAGDADPACAEKASVFTPVPGGVGPIAVAMIFKNLSALAQK